MQITTGCPAEDREAAEQALSQYIVSKWEPARRPILRIPIADPLALYARDVAPGHARPRATAQIIDRLLSFFGERVVSAVNGALCRQYAATRPSGASARRELEVLQAALNHFHREGHMREVVRVVLPVKSPPRERWLTRSEAAHLVWTAWRHKERQGHVVRHTRRHIAKFILFSVYTGRRAGAVCETRLGRSIESAYVDLEQGTWNPRPGRKRTTKRQPAIRLPPRLLAHLRRWHRLGQRHVVEYAGDRLTRPDHSFRDVARKAGMDDVTPHTLRHTATTWLMQAGADPWHVAGFVGMSLIILMQTYGHHHPDHLSSAVRALDRRQRIANESRDKQ
jgi:integrase